MEDFDPFDPKRMPMRTCTASLLLCLTVFFGHAGAGDKKPRSPEHKVLESLAGTYDAKIKLYVDPKTFKEYSGVMTRTMILDGNYLQENFEGKLLDFDFTGLGIIGYDAARKKYFTTWFDDMSTSTSIMFGTFDADTKTLTSFGEDVDAAGKKSRARDVLKIIGPNEQVFEMYRQRSLAAPEDKVMEIVFTRKK